jgi:hypothetical protein
MSIRDAARLGQTSHTTWARFEESGHVTHAIRKAVADAFGWDATWPEQPPSMTLPVYTDGLARIEQLLHEISEHTDPTDTRLAIERNTGELSRLVALVERQLTALTERVTQLEHPTPAPVIDIVQGRPGRPGGAAKLPTTRKAADDSQYPKNRGKG